MSNIFTSHFIVVYFGVHNCCLGYHSTSWNSFFSDFTAVLWITNIVCLYQCQLSNSPMFQWLKKKKKKKIASWGWKALGKWVWPIFISVRNTIQPHTQQTWMTINHTNCSRQNVLLHAASVNFTLSVFCQGKQNKPPYTHQSPHPPQNKTKTLHRIKTFRSCMFDVMIVIILMCMCSTKKSDVHSLPHTHTHTKVWHTCELWVWMEVL